MDLVNPIRKAKLGLMLFFPFALPLVMAPPTPNYQYLKLVLAFFSISLLLLLWMAELLLDKRVPFNMPTTFWLGLLLIEVALISLVNSDNIRVGLESLGALICFFLFYLLLTNAVKEEKTAFLLLASVFTAAVLAALYGLIQYYGYELTGPYRVRPGIGSIISTMGNKNYLGGFLAYLYVPYGLLLLKAPRPWQKGLILAGMGLIWWAIMAIGARAIWLGLAVGVISLALAVASFHFKLLRLKLVRRNWRWIGALGVLMAVITAIFFFPNPANKSGTVIGRVATGIKALAGPYVRYYDWWVTWEMIKAHPFIGIGLGDFKLEFLDYKAKFLETPRGEQYKDLYIAQALQAHNEYLQIWAELGTLGLLISAGIISMIFYQGWRKIKGYSHSYGGGRGGKGRKVQVRVHGEVEGERALFTLVLLAGVLSFLVHAFFSFPLHLPASALNLVLMLALLDSDYLASAGAGQKQSFRPKRHSRWVLALVISILALTVITSAARDFIAEIYMRKGQAQLAKGNLDGAKEHLEESLRWDFEPKEALFNLGVIYTKEKEYRKAKEVLERSLSSYPRVTSLFNLGIVALGLGDFEESIRYLDLVTQIDPTDLDYLYQKAEVYLLAGRAEEGREILEGIIARNKNYYRAYMGLAEYFNDKGMKGRAVENYHQALGIIAERLTGLLERVRKPLLSKREYDRIKKEIAGLREDKEEIEAELEILQGESQEEAEIEVRPSPAPGSPAIGSPDAPVTIVEFLDLLCPFCARFAVDTLPKIMERYVRPGKVRIIFRFFVIPGEVEELVAEAALCADEQGKFMEYHDILLAKTHAGEPPRTAEALKGLAAGLGLDTRAFARCLDSHEYAGVIERDIDEALSLGVKGTPTFFIEGRKLEGAVPFEEFQRLIEEGLRG
ncbi:TPA: tetratricopeptide repeat protein [Candidatus Bipolaricaulota bacterium]|nr:tetratricopeptide repeat protein [Candidatus Bipolaricaulota bacterium]